MTCSLKRRNNRSDSNNDNDSSARNARDTMEYWQRILFYSMAGVFVEVLFTAAKSLIFHYDFMLHGNTQLWVILLYAIGGHIYEQIYVKVRDTRRRILIYYALVYILEYSAGWVLAGILGECPWLYTSAGNVHGLIQLTYAPFWFMFVLVANYTIGYMLSHKFVKIATTIDSVA